MWPQGPTGADTVVIDFTPLRVNGEALVKIREQVTEVVQSTLQGFSAQGPQGYSSAEEENEDDEQNSKENEEVEEEEEEDAVDEESLSILRIETGRSEAKAVCQAAWDFWQTHTKTGIRLAE